MNIASDSKRVLFTDFSKIFVFDVATEQLITSFKIIHETIYCMLSGNYLFLGSHYSFALYDLSGNIIVSSDDDLRLGEEEVYGMHFFRETDDSARIVTFNMCGQVMFFDVDIKNGTMEKVKQLELYMCCKVLPTTDPHVMLVINDSLRSVNLNIVTYDLEEVFPAFSPWQVSGNGKYILSSTGVLYSADPTTGYKELASLENSEPRLTRFMLSEHGDVQYIVKQKMKVQAACVFEYSEGSFRLAEAFDREYGLWVTMVNGYIIEEDLRNNQIHTRLIPRL
ncbi:hypothetical protein PCE1_001660 [Barthelona sp. PCE]